MKGKLLLLLAGIFTVANLFSQSEIDVSVTSLSDTLETGSSSSLTFIIENTGDADLEYDISVYTDTLLFTKIPYADYTLEENQDLISEDIILTRGKIRGLFNIAQESKFDSDNYDSPFGTEWTYGLTEGNNYTEYDPGTSNFYADDEYSMYIPEENRFFDMYFHEWTQGGQGSGVSYTRVETVPWLSNSPDNGTITAMNSEEITVTFDASYIGAGEYYTEIVIHSNDADESEIIIPVNMLVTGGTGEIETDGAFNFGDVVPNTIANHNFVIYNSGDGILSINDITTQSSYFSVSIVEVEIFGFLQASLTLSFEPTEEIEYVDTLTITSVDETIQVPLVGFGYYPPDLSLNAEEFNFIIDLGLSESATLTLSNLNTNGDSLVWSVPEHGSIAYMMANINENVEELKATVPYIFEFDYDSYADPDYYISDGGADMFDGANYLNTNYESEIYYSNNTVNNGMGAFGDEANYFTRDIRGYFIMVAEMDDVNSFSIEGNNGADSDGTVDTLRGNIEINGIEYLVISKQVNEQDEDPSINHIFILETPDQLTHLVSDDTNDDYDEIQFGDDVELLHYLMIGARDEMGYDLDSTTLFEIAEYYIETVTTEDGAIEAIPDWLIISESTSGIIYEDSSIDLELMVNTDGMEAGIYYYTLVFNNVGQEGFQYVDINLTVVDTATTFIKEEVSVFGSKVYPNPVVENLFIETEIGASIQIFDCTGKLVYSSIISKDIEDINSASFDAGVYIVQIRNEKGTISKKVIIK